MSYRPTTAKQVNVHVEADAKIEWIDWTRNSHGARPYVTVTVADVCFYLHHPDQVEELRDALNEALGALVKSSALSRDAEQMCRDMAEQEAFLNEPPF